MIVLTLGVTQPLPRRLSSHLSMDNQVCIQLCLYTVIPLLSQFTEDWNSVFFQQGVQPTTQPTQPVDVSISETQPSCKSVIFHCITNSQPFNNHPERLAFQLFASTDIQCNCYRTNTRVHCFCFSDEEASVCTDAEPKTSSSLPDQVTIPPNQNTPPSFVLFNNIVYNLSMWICLCPVDRLLRPDSCATWFVCGHQ